MEIKLVLYDSPTQDLNLISDIMSYYTMKAMEEVARYAERVHKDRFRRQVSPDNQRWADLRPSTWARKGKRALVQFSLFGRLIQFGGTARMLVVSGDLEGSLKFYTQGGFTVIGEATDFKASFHQLGTRYMPARPFMGLNENDIGEIDKIIEKYQDQAFAKELAGETFDTLIQSLSKRPGAVSGLSILTGAFQSVAGAATSGFTRTRFGGLTGSQLTNREFGGISDDASFKPSNLNPGFFDIVDAAAERR